MCFHNYRDFVSRNGVEEYKVSDIQNTESITQSMV